MITATCFAHLVVVDHPPDFLAERGVSEGGAGASRGPPRQRGEVPLGRDEEVLALAPPLVRQQRIEARDEALARIGRRRDLREVLSIEQRELEGPAVDQRANRRAA